MTKLDTGASTHLTTQPGASGQIEIKSDKIAPPRVVPTGPYYGVHSVPSGDPELPEAEGDRYVFRIGDSPHSETVTITIDARQFVEQARVRKINRAIQRARQ